MRVHPILRRRPVRLTAAVALLLTGGLVLAACSSGPSTPSSTPAAGGDDAKLSGSITAAEWGGIWDTALQQVSPGFTKDTGVTVDNTVNPGNVTVTLQQNPGSYDLAWTIGTTAVQAYQQGSTEAIDTKKIPAWKDLNPTLKKALTVDGKVVAVPISYGAEGILYRKDLVPFKITGWKDLWNPKLKGQITLQQAPSIGGLMVMMAAGQEYGKGIDDSTTGFKQMEKLAPNVQYLYTVSSDPINRLASGSIWATVTLANQGVPLESKDVGVVIPSDGTGYSLQAIAIPKASKNKAAVYAYINYLLEEQNQIAWAATAAAAPANSAVKLPSYVQAKVLETPEVGKHLWDIDWDEFAAKTPEWTTQFQQIFAK